MDRLSGHLRDISATRKYGSADTKHVSTGVIIALANRAEELERYADEADAYLANTLIKVRELAQGMIAQDQSVRALEFSMASALTELDRLRNALHRRSAHPDYEYTTTTCGRKSGDYPEPEGDGWEPNDFIDMGSNPETGEPYPRRHWERYDYTEDYYWRRRKESVDMGGTE